MVDLSCIALRADLSALKEYLPTVSERIASFLIARERLKQALRIAASRGAKKRAQRGGFCVLWGGGRGHRARW